MVDNQDNIETEEDKNLSPELRNLIDEANIHAKSAEEKILEAYEYAINIDKLEPKQAAKILKENLFYSPQWIMHFLPQEAKQLQNKKVKADSPFLQENEPKDVNFTTSTVIKDAVLLEEPEPIKPRDLGELSINKDNWRPPPTQERKLTDKELNEMMESDAQAMEDMERERKELLDKGVDVFKDNKMELIMPRKDVVKLVNELRIDVLARMSKDGFVKFIMDDKSLTYELV